MSITEYLNAILEAGFKKGAFDARQLNPVMLAYIGDTVFDLYVRTFLLAKEQSNTHNLHKKSITYVCAAAQSKACLQLMEEFTEEEQYIYKRGRNAHPSTMPKNADVTQYRTATGLEAVLGYLYLSRQFTRLDALLERILSSQNGGSHAQGNT